MNGLREYLWPVHASLPVARVTAAGIHDILAIPGVLARRLSFVRAWLGQQAEPDLGRSAQHTYDVCLVPGGQEEDIGGGLRALTKRCAAAVLLGITCAGRTLNRSPPESTLPGSDARAHNVHSHQAPNQHPTQLPHDNEPRAVA